MSKAVTSGWAWVGPIAPAGVSGGATLAGGGAGTLVWVTGSGLVAEGAAGALSDAAEGAAGATVCAAAVQASSRAMAAAGKFLAALRARQERE